MDKLDSLLTSAVLADELGVTESALAKWRVTGDGPPFLKLGHRLIRYPRSGVETWKLDKLRQRTCDRRQDQRPALMEAA